MRPASGAPERRDGRLGPAARLVLGAHLGLGTPRRLAEQDRPPRLGEHPR